jgi:rod shape-determining protein MreD
VKALGLLGAVALAVALQTTLARFTAGSRWMFDMVLLAVVYVALRWGASAGVIGGTLGGLLQDALAGTTIGVGGLAKTIIGFVAGVIGSQFIVARPLPRLVLVAGATVGSRLIVIGLTGMISLQWPAVSWLAMLSEIALNALAAFVLFQGIESVPGLWRRGPSRRSAFGRRKW